MRFGPTLDTFVAHDLDLGIVPMLLGEPGTGKTSFMKALAASRGTRCFCVPVNQLACKEDLTGARLMPDGEGGYATRFFPMQTVAEAIAYAESHPGEGPVLFLDEINRTAPDVTSAALTLVTERRLGADLPENLRLACAGNSHGNVSALDTASVSRFSLYEVEPDVERFVAVAECPGWLEDMLRDDPACLCEVPDPDGAYGPDGDADRLVQIATPRTIEALGRWVSSFRPQELRRFLSERSTLPGRASMSVMEEAVRGKVGDTRAAELAMKRICALSRAKAATAPAAAVPDPVRPACFDAVDLARTQAELEAAVAAMSAAELSQSLVWALFEPRDRSRTVAAIAGRAASLAAADAGLLRSLSQAGRLDPGNVAAFLALSGPLADSYRCLFTA